MHRYAVRDEECTKLVLDKGTERKFPPISPERLIDTAHDTYYNMYAEVHDALTAALERLAAYEDTGLLPDAVKAMQRAYTTMAGRVQKAELEKEEAMKLAESRYRYIRSLGSAIEQGYDDHEHLEQLLAQCDEERKRYKDEVEALKSEMRKEGTL